MNDRAKRPALAVEQRTELQVKKIILELDLTAEQQKKITKIVANQLNKTRKKSELKKDLLDILKCWTKKLHIEMN